MEGRVPASPGKEGSSPHISQKMPAANVDSTTATARTGKTPDCSMSIRLLRRFTNLRPSSSALHALARKFCEICGLAGKIGLENELQNRR